MSEDDSLDLGTAGASARREHERRKINREQRVRGKHPRLGNLILALKDEPSHEAVWARGAGGEEHVAKVLAKHVQGGYVLHDRRVPRSRANIDHIAVAASGVWVIDSKRYRGRVAVAKPLFGQAKLLIAGRDRSKLADGLARQVELVESSVREVAPDVPVHGVLCFVEADLPVLRTLSFKGFPLLHPKPLAKRINAAGALTPDRAEIVVGALAAHFPAA